MTSVYTMYILGVLINTASFQKALYSGNCQDSASAAGSCHEVHMCYQCLYVDTGSGHTRLYVKSII